MDDLEVRRARLALAEAENRLETYPANSTRRARLALEVRELREQLDQLDELLAGASEKVEALIRQSIARRVAALRGRRVNSAREEAALGGSVRIV
mgnify:CR=1 FL=1